MKKNILIAEDDKSILEVVKLILENEGYTIISTDREQSIYKEISVQTPDLILLDIWLAGEDGGVIAKNLKTRKETQHIPIIIMSANNETEKITKATGADDFLLKPFNIDDLLQIVKKYSN